MKTELKHSKVSDKTKQKLIKTGLSLFADSGYDGVSVRQISETANMNIASINYHFGSKYELYIAVADHINEQLSLATKSTFESAKQFLESPHPQATDALDHILSIVINLIDVIMSDTEETDAWIRFINRFENGDHIPNHELSRKLFSTALADLVAVARGEPNAKLENSLIAQTLFGQVLVFRVDSFTSKELLDIDTFGEEQVMLIKKVISSNIKKILA